MEFTSYVKRPVVVEAVEITEQNIEEVAHYIGEVRMGEGRPFIIVDERLVPDGFRKHSRVYPGAFLTKVGDNVRWYTRKSFIMQFIKKDEQMIPWLEYMSKDIPYYQDRLQAPQH